MEKPNQLDIDKVINRLIQNPNYPMVYQADIRAICFKARQIMLSQPIFLQLKAPIKVCGDIHGQFHDLVKIFQTVGYPDSTSFLFIGDYVDRGKQSIQSIMLLLAYKIKYPQTFYLLRGNHESSSVNRLYGFYDECKRKFNLKIWKLFNDIFNTIPICARIQQKILCMHGGLSPQLQNFRQISSISRPVEAPDQGLICDILWSDPQKMAKGWQKNHQRGISYTFGYDVLQLFMKKHNIDLICRAHQVVEQGYQFFGNRKLVTIFSAPNYCGQFDNHGAVMNVDAQLVCSFDIIQAYRKKKM